MVLVGIVLLFFMRHRSASLVIPIFCLSIGIIAISEEYIKKSVHSRQEDRDRNKTLDSDLFE